MDYKATALRRLKALRNQTKHQTQNMIEFYRNKSSLKPELIAQSLEGEFYEIRKMFEREISLNSVFRNMTEDEDDRETSMKKTQLRVKKLIDLCKARGIKIEEQVQNT